MEQLKTYIPKKEFRTYYIGALGQGMVYGIMSSYISDFYLNVFKLTPIFVLLLMLLARVWDAINDPMMGIIMDRSNPKRGKMRTYLLYTPLPIAILTLLMFFAPDLSLTMKMVYAATVYILWGMIYTVGDVPFWSMPNALTPDPAERGKLISISRTTNGIGSAVPLVLFLVLNEVMKSTGSTADKIEKQRYFIMALVAVVVGCTLYFKTYFGIKERVNVPSSPKRDENAPGALKLIFSCKPLLLVALTGILSCGRYMYQAAAIHVARYSIYIGPELSTIASEKVNDAMLASINKVSLFFNLSTAVGMFATMIIVPKFYKRFSYKQLLIYSCILGSASSFLMYLVGYNNFYLCIPLLVISSIPLGVINVVSYAMVGDALDYMEWKTGYRQTGMGSACQSFVLKLGNALATSAIILTYMIIGLNVNTIGTKQYILPGLLSNEIRGGMFSLVSLIPAISLLLCIIPMFFYDLTGEKKDKITKELRQQRIDRGIITE